ncbi:hypothetical protein SLA2020_235980 [Shorea laevis]
MLKEITLVLLIGLLAWTYQAIQPPPPQICGSPGGPPITAPRIKLRDGRYLAYEEHGLSKDTARYKIIFVHGFASGRYDEAIATNLSPEVIEVLGVHVVSFDRPGYGESDPNPKRTLKSMALDVEELADQLGLGPKFYIIGLSMGGHTVWSCLKYIPHRLAGATLLAPVVNYWWPGFPANLSTEAYHKQPLPDQWTLRVAHHIPWLTYWWNTQKLFPASSVVALRRHIFSPQDIQLLPKISDRQQHKPRVTQQGVYESLHRDMMIGFGKWEFDPMDLDNPFPDKEGSVHLWQGDDDRLVPVSLQSYIAKKLGWIQYHELPGSGHIFPYADGMSEAILRALLFGEGDSSL